jgi:hypothetical protein
LFYCNQPGLSVWEQLFATDRNSASRSAPLGITSPQRGPSEDLPDMRHRLLGQEIPVSRFGGLRLLTATGGPEPKPPRHVPI